MTRTTSPHVYRAISRVSAEFAKLGIAKARTNLPDQYQYRSIDDVTCRLAPLLPKYGLCVLPRVLRRKSRQCFNADGDVLTHVRLLVAYDLVSSRDASRASIRVWAEALDASDKGTAKAMSSAYKSAMVQLFCIPVAGEDADAHNPKLKQEKPTIEPPQGWEAWASDIGELVIACESQAALDVVRTRQASLLAALKRERPNLYAAVGEIFGQRSTELQEGVRPVLKVREAADA